MRYFTFLACCAIAAARASYGMPDDKARAESPVAMVDGQPILPAELDEVIGPQQLLRLRNEEYELRSKALENLIRRKLIVAHAAKSGMPPEEMLKQQVDAKVPEPTDGEVEAYFLGQSQSGARLEDVREQYRKNLKSLRIQKARQDYADSLRSSVSVAVLLRPPAMDVAHDAKRVRGEPDAPVTIVEFSDYQCPYCKQAEATLAEILDRYEGRVKLAFLDFPLRAIHPQAEQAAEAARCAGEQGKFWEFHDALFADQSRLKEADFIADAQTLGLNQDGFRSCLSSGRYKPEVEKDLAEGAKVGVAGTPGFFVNGVFLNGAQPRAEFERIIESQLSLALNRPLAKGN